MEIWRLKLLDKRRRVKEPVKIKIFLPLQSRFQIPVTPQLSFQELDDFCGAFLALYNMLNHISVG